jgi:hypothetical protein
MSNRRRARPAQTISQWAPWTGPASPAAATPAPPTGRSTSPTTALTTSGSTTTTGAPSSEGCSADDRPPPPLRLLSLVPSEIHPGEQYIAGGGLGVGATAAPAGRPLSTPPGRGRATPRARPAHGITRTGRPSATGPPTLGPGRDTPRHSSPALLPPAPFSGPLRPRVARDRKRSPARQRPLQAAGDPPRRGPQGVDQAVPPGCAIPGGGAPPAHPGQTPPGRHRPADTPVAHRRCDTSPGTRHSDDTDNRRTTCPTPAATAAREPRPSRDQ